MKLGIALSDRRQRKERGRRWNKLLWGMMKMKDIRGTVELNRDGNRSMIRSAKVETTQERKGANPNR